MRCLKERCARQGRPQRRGDLAVAVAAVRVVREADVLPPAARLSD